MTVLVTANFWIVLRIKFIRNALVNVPGPAEIHTSTPKTSTVYGTVVLVASARMEQSLMKIRTVHASIKTNAHVHTVARHS